MPVTRYAKSGDVHVAYQVFGNGPIDLVIVPGFVSHIENYWDHPDLARAPFLMVELHQVCTKSSIVCLLFGWNTPRLSGFKGLGQWPTIRLGVNSARKWQLPSQFCS